MQIYNTLNPVFETAILLLHGTQIETLRQTYVEQLNQFGVEGTVFWKKHSKMLDKYIRTFQKNRVSTPEDDWFFEDFDMKSYPLIVFPFFQNNKLLNEIDNADSKSLQQNILTCYNQIYETDILCLQEWDLGEIIRFLDDSPFHSNVKWKLMLLLQDPKPYYQKLAKIIQDNLQAFEKAQNAIQSSLTVLLHQYEKNHPLLGNCETIVSSIIPTMVLPGAQILVDESCYCGLLCNKIVQMGSIQSNAKQALLANLKVLSEKSKLEILTLLKARPYYSAEIAAQLGLTAATVSFHMNALLAREMVTIEKQDGRIYFLLNKEVLEFVLHKLETLLLK